MLDRGELIMAYFKVMSQALFESLMGHYYS